MRRSLVRRSTKSCFDHHCLLCSQCLHPPSPRRSTRQMTAGGVCSPRAVRAVWLWVHTHTNTRGRTCQDQDARKQNTKRDVVARVSGLLFGEQLTADRDCIGFASSARVPGSLSLRRRQKPRAPRYRTERTGLFMQNSAVRNGFLPYIHQGSPDKKNCFL